MHTCIHTYIHIYIHAYIHTYIYTYIHTYIHTIIVARWSIIDKNTDRFETCDICIVDLKLKDATLFQVERLPKLEGIGIFIKQEHMIRSFAFAIL